MLLAGFHADGGRTMENNWDKIFPLVLQHEGGFTNNAHDPGGATNLGVTRAAWESYLGHLVSIEDMKKLTPAAVKPFYKKMYWDKVHGDELQSGVDYCVVDAAINSGVKNAALFLQRVVDVNEDGTIGLGTLKAANRMNPLDLIEDYCDTRLAFLRKLSTFHYFGKGWTRRVTEVETTAKQMAEP